MTYILLSWPNFRVDIGVVNLYYRGVLSSNYDGLVATEDYMTVMFKADYSDDDATAANTYWNALTSTSFNPTNTQIAEEKIQGAIDFGQQMLLAFAAQNVLAGITQAGKTQPVMDYCHELTHCLLTGSLYAAIGVIGGMIADTSSTKTNLAPFVTNVVLYQYLNMLQTYLELTITPYPGA